MHRLVSIFTAMTFAVSLCATAMAASFNDEQKTEMEDVIHHYLVEHPEVLAEVAKALDAKEKKAEQDAQAQTLGEAGKDIFHDATDAVVGNVKGDVTVVEFMDYNCGYCKKDLAEMQAVVAGDKNIRVVMKEWPIFGPDSEYAAKAAMAAAKQGKYWDLHQALFSNQGHVSADVVDKLAKGVGIDVMQMKSDMKDESIVTNLGRTEKLATSLQFTGTPGFLVDNHVYPGYQTRDQFKLAIAKARSEGGCKAC